MDKVNIFTYTTVRGPGTKDGSFTYILEYITDKGPATLTKHGTLEKVTEKQAELQTVLEAIGRLRKQCEITIYTESNYLKRGAEDWLPGWISAEWKNTRGKPVANSEEWQQMAKKLGEHAISFEVGKKHSYYAWLHTETEKKEQERKACTTNLENLTQHQKSMN